MILTELNNPNINVYPNLLTSTAITFSATGSLMDSAMSYSGTYQYVISMSNVYVSTDGVSFSSTFFDGYDGFNSIVSDSSGQYLVVGSSIFGVYISSNFGSTFASSSSFAQLSTICNSLYSDASGSIVVATSLLGLFTSFVDLSPTNSPTNIPTYILGQPTNIPLQLPTTFPTVTISSRPSITFTPTLAPTSTSIPTSSPVPTIFTGSSFVWNQAISMNQIWQAIAISTTGQYQTAVVFGGYIYSSMDYGYSWSPSSTLAKSWEDISMSGDGKYQTAVENNGYIYISSNFGNSFSATATNLIKIWSGVAMSNSGQYQSSTIMNSYIYRTTNYGQTWTQVASSKLWNDIAMNSLGDMQVAVIQNGLIYISTNYGSTWVMSAFVNTWLNIALSSSGQYVTALAQTGFVYISADFASTWSAVGVVDYQWFSVSISNSGQFQITSAINDHSMILISSDFGKTWEESYVLVKPNDNRFQDVAISGNAQYMLANQNDGFVFITSTTGTIVNSNQPSHGPTYKPTLELSSPPTVSYPTSNDNNNSESSSTDSKKTSSTLIISIVVVVVVLGLLLFVFYWYKRSSKTFEDKKDIGSLSTENRLSRPLLQAPHDSFI